jgi:hypothetical protein
MSALKTAGSMIKKVAIYFWQPIGDRLKILWIAIKQMFVNGVNGIIIMVNDLINLMNRVPGVSMNTIGLISTSYEQQVAEILANSGKFEELFSQGVTNTESTAEQIKGIWAGLKSEIFALNEGQKESSDDATQNELNNQNARAQGLEVVKQKIEEVKNKEVESYQTTLSGLRNSIKGFLAQAIAKVIQFRKVKNGSNKKVKR